MRSVSEDIKKRDFAPVYVIYGEEAYLRENYRNALRKALTDPQDTLNFAKFSGKETDPDEVVALAVTLPFMAEKRVILVQDSGFFKSATDAIADYIESPAEDTVLIFEESEVDKRNKAFRLAKKAGYDVEAAKYGVDKLPDWVAMAFKRQGKKVSRETVNGLIDRVGSDMQGLDMEVKKISSYAGEREAVTGEDVLAVVSRNPAFTVFQMIDAIAEKKLNRAVGIYYDMLSEKESPFGILALMERHFRILMIAKDMSEKKLDNAAIASAAGVAPNIIWKYVNQSKKYSKTRIRGILDACVRADRDIKLGLAEDSVSVEMLIIGVASK